MPRYHFNVSDGQDMPDLDGHELPDLESARNEAVALAGALLKDHGQKFWSGQTWHMDVTDHTGLLLFRLDFTAALSPAAQSSA